MPTSEWPQGLAEDLRDSGFWHEPYGDRQTELRIEIASSGGEIVGDKAAGQRAIEAALDACLLTDAEFAAGPLGWDEMKDPFLEEDARRPFGFLPEAIPVNGGAAVECAPCE